MKRWSHYSLIGRGLFLFLVTLVVGVSVYAALRVQAMVFDWTASHVTAIPASEKPEAEVITILPSGFESEEIVRPAGRLVLVFDNQSGMQSLEFRLERSGFPRVTEMKLKRKTDSTAVLNLPPGEYRVTETNHSEWSLKLTLSNR